MTPPELRRDAEIGPGVNMGAGSIVVNYDGGGSTKQLLRKVLYRL